MTMPEDKQDPSALTQAQLYREIILLEQRLTDKVEAVKDTARVIHDDYTRVPTLLDRAIAQLREFLETRIEGGIVTRDEKFRGVEERFTSSIAATKELLTETNKALTASVAKSESGMKDSIKSLEELFKTEIRGLNDKYVGLNSRFDKSDGGNTTIVAMGAGLIAVLSLIFTGYNVFHGPQQSQPQQPVVQYLQSPVAPIAPIAPVAPVAPVLPIAPK